eukprot:CAMPEP_0174828994 /NCGR_PEP_ID=MMETSP1114-20130205/1654_1 /TAXON_ID=312471 /ORGANISM="Neobodo designis, Strain CCAP 1951/1" /LENGTH=299 /DNA_ID=CAMNT_0016062727 /DNA_START=36 /DNA_END=935 /DNA_ORIENTATION=-
MSTRGSSPAAKAHRSEGAPASRWSDGKYFNQNVPSYVPSELIIFDNGAALDVFLQRAHIEDARRLSERADDPSVYFLRRNGPMHVEPRFDSAGNRVNSYAQLLKDKREALQKVFHERARRFNKTSYRGDREIVKKIFFTQKQFDEKAYGAILGSRGATHKMLERETNCRIVLGGKGITLGDKAINLRNYERTQEMMNERPHCRITAPSEAALQKAVERVEWILSDTPDAIRFRDKMRMQLAKDNGTFDAATWEPTPIPGQTTTVAGAAKAAGDAAAGGAAAGGDEDAELEDVFADLDGM